MLAEIYRVRLAVFLSFLLTCLFATSALSQVSLPVETLRTDIAIKKPLTEMLVATSSEYATSAAIDASGNTYVVIYWNPQEEVVGYNLYRRKKTATSFPTTPLNRSKLISSVTTCSGLKAIIPEGSAEWNMLKDAFSALSEKKRMTTKSRSIDEKSMKATSRAPMDASKIVTTGPVIEKAKLGKGVLSTTAGIGMFRPDLAYAAANPCTVIERGLTAREAALFDTLAAANLKIRLARGLGYIDYSVVANTRYVYELRGVKSDSSEVVIQQNIAVWAGHYTLPAPPSNFSVTPGDRKVLCLWDKNKHAATYMVKRWSSTPGTYEYAHTEPVIYNITKDLDGNVIIVSLLFSINSLSLQSDMDDGNVSEALQEAFAVNGITLSDSAAVEIEEKGNKWLVADTKTYAVRKSGAKLDVYKTSKPGLVDYQRWSDDGIPISHDVDTPSGTIIVDGPENGTEYRYKVASRDILDREGSWSRYQSATPVDKTPPTAPDDFTVSPSTSPVGLALSWRKVTKDIDGHQEQDTSQTYRIYRAEKLDDLDDVTSLDTSSSLYVHSLIANPTDTTIMTITWTNTDSILVLAYGEKDFYYRLQCVDDHSNVSSPSAAIGGRAPDTTPPGGTYVTRADGHADHITVFWQPNSEPDLAGYQIWRSVCDKGKPYRPEHYEDDKYDQRVKCDFFLVGEILLKEAKKRLEETGDIYYEDYTVPDGSPICYAYWMRAFDVARNLYPGKFDNECPDTGEYVCQRLYEETPPPVPVVSGLKAKNNSVLVEWISSPIQDLRAFHIYRSKKESDPPDFVGCVFIDGMLNLDAAGEPVKWGGLKPKCEDIPAEPDPNTVKGSFTDNDNGKGLEPNQVFWYRVSAVDWLGNESEGSDITKIPALSTFTYSKDLPGTPVILPHSGSAWSGGCGMVVRWTPSFDPVKFQGFIVFRSTSAAGTYRQISPVVDKNEFVDESALPGINYWYRVQSMDTLDKLSEPSVAVHYKY